MSAKFLIRSLLIFPGHVDKFFLSAINSESDAIAIDLEDAVPEVHKKQARESVKEKLDSIGENNLVFVRINSINSGFLELDIKESIHEKLTGFILPMIESEEDIFYIDKVVSKIEKDSGIRQGKIKFFPLIERASAVLNALSIAKASKRNIGLIFGHEDFLLDVHAPQTKDKVNLLVPRATIAMAARAIGGIPVDAPYLEISDMQGFSDNVNISRSLGFSGILAIHKKQVSMSNEKYMPSDEEVQEAREVVKQVKQSESEGRSISFVNGRFAGPPIVKSAEQLLKKYDYFIGKDGNNSR
jgi:citrate lyase subunit beta / citryl-CoA lyase